MDILAKGLETLNSAKTLIFVMTGSAVLAYLSSGAPGFSSAPASWHREQQQIAVGPLVIVTAEYHPGFRPVQLNQGNTRLLKMGDSEPTATAAKVQP